MSKKKNRGWKGPANTLGQPQGVLQEPAIDPRVTEIQAAYEEAQAVVTETDISAISSEPRPEGTDLDKLWNMVREARDIFRSRTRAAEVSLARADEIQRRNESKAAELDERAAALQGRKGEIDALETEVSERLEALDHREKELASRDADLVAREIALRQRALNAEAGFVAERRAALSALEESATGLTEEIAKTERIIAEQRTAWLAEQQAQRKKFNEELRAVLDARRADAEKELAEREEELAKWEQEVQRVRRELDSLRRQLEYEDQHLRELRENLERRVEQRSAAVREELEHQVRALEAQLQQARKDRDAYESLLRKREDADRRFGQRTPEQVLREMDDLRAEREKLQAALAERPDVEAAARLRQLEVERETWEAERLDLHRKVAEVERRLARANISAVELETLRDQKAALESGRSALQQALTELKAEVNTLISRADAKAPFPDCTDMDADPELQVQGLTYETIGDLAAFVDDLRHRIAFDPGHPDRLLYYSLEHVRSFLAGLAMSPLVLLQGISGTGKTSLPIAFARAMGTKATVVEVQAGWRDPQDLVGHYNVFEKRFYEREFLKGLYRARTRRWADTIQIVLLDEMNLSHPEHYFSEMLSTLEHNPEDRRLALVQGKVDPAPALLDGGNALPLSPNVWFVGTANHDETTKDFADKTYDRAHVMQFPTRPEPFQVNKRPSPRPPVSFKALRTAFDEAIKRHDKAADKAIEFLDTRVREHLARYFEIGWGPRLERQLRRYVPVVVAAGGSVSEAIDHVLAMRLLRKLRNRHDNRREDLEALRQQIERAWPDLDRRTKPQRSTEILLSELRRLGWAPEDNE
jgi:hypothetical protein